MYVQTHGGRSLDAGACDLRCDLERKTRDFAGARRRETPANRTFRAVGVTPPYFIFVTDNKKSRFAGLFKPSSGLEPETPLLTMEVAPRCYVTCEKRLVARF